MFLLFGSEIELTYYNSFRNKEGVAFAEEKCVDGSLLLGRSSQESIEFAGQSCGYNTVTIDDRDVLGRRSCGLELVVTADCAHALRCGGDRQSIVLRRGPE